MTQPPTTEEWSAKPASAGPAELTGAILSAAADSAVVPNSYEHGVPIPFQSAFVDQSGRPLGPRALRTRARILEATISLLDDTSIRDLRVIDIARRIGSSPATFYQYFKDVNDVVLELASEVSEYTPEMIELIRGDWTGRAGHERGVRLGNLVIDYWEKYRAILRVRNNAADEGNPAFQEVRQKAMLPMVMALGEVISAAHEAAKSDGFEDPESQLGKIAPMSSSIFLYSMLESMARYHQLFEKRFASLGENRDSLIGTCATILQSTLTSRR